MTTVLTRTRLMHNIEGRYASEDRTVFADGTYLVGRDVLHDDAITEITRECPEAAAAFTATHHSVLAVNTWPGRVEWCACGERVEGDTPRAALLALVAHIQEVTR